MIKHIKCTKFAIMQNFVIRNMKNYKIYIYVSMCPLLKDSSIFYNSFNVTTLAILIISYIVDALIMLVCAPSCKIRAMNR